MIGGMVMLVGLCVSQAAGAESPFGFRDINSVGLELSENGKPVFVYNYGMLLAPGFRKGCVAARICILFTPRMAHG